MSDFKLVSLLAPVVVLTGGPALSAGTQSQATGTISFANSNGVSFGLSNGTLTASAAGGGGGAAFSAGASNLGNTAGQTGTISNQLVLAGGNNITLSQATAAGGATITIVGPATAAQTVQTQNMVSVQGSTGDISFVNSNGIAFGANNSTITASYTVPNTAGLISAVRVSAGTTSGDQTGLTFSNSNGMTFGLNAGVVTASYTVPSVPAQTVQPVAASGSNGSFNFSTITFGALNGLTFYTSNGSMVGSYTVPTVPAQTNQSLGLYAVSNTTGQSSSTTADARSLSFHGAGIASVGYSNGSVVVSVPSGGGGGDGGNVIAAGTQTATTLGTVKFENSNGISFGMSGSTQVTASYTVPSTAGLLSAINLSAGTTSNNLSAMTFSNANGVTFGLNGSVITASITPAGGAQTGVSGISAGTTQLTSGTAVFGDANGISFGVNGQTLTASHNALTSQSNQALSGSNGSFAFQTATFGALNGLSFYTSNGSMVASYTVPNVPAQTVQPVAVSGSNGSFAFSTLTLGALNGLTFYTSNGSVVGSYTVPATAGLLSAINLSAGTTSGNLSAATFSNSNGITFGLNAGTITASHNGLTTARASTDGVGLATAQSNVTWTVNSNGISFDARSYAGVGTSATNASITLNSNGLAISVAAPGGGGGAALSAGTQSGNTGTIVFANSNGLTFGMSGSSQITGSYTVPTQTNQTIGLYATSNTTGASSSSTYDARSLTVRGYGVLSVGHSNGSLLLSTPDPVVFTQLSVGNSTGGNTAGNTGLVTGQFVLAGGANITLSGSTNAGSMTLSVIGGAGGGGGGAALSAGTQSVSTGTVAFSNSNGITFGMSGSNQITASYNSTQFAGQGTTFAGANISASITLNSAGLNLSASVAPPGAAAENNAIALLGANTSGNTTATGSTIGWSGIGLTLSGTNNSQVVISAPATSSIVGAGGISLSTAGNTITLSYTRGVLTNYRGVEAGNNTTYSSLGQNTVQFQNFIPENEVQMAFAEIWARGSFVSSTNSQVYAQTVRYGIYSEGSGASSTQMSLAGSSSMTMNVSYNSNTAYGVTVGNGATSFTTSSGGTVLATNFSGPMHVYMPFSTTLQPNVKHAFAMAISSATTVGTNPMRFAVLVQTVMNSLSMGRLFVTGVVAPATSVIGDREMAVYSATSGALPSSYATSQVSIAVSRQVLPFMLEI